MERTGFPNRDATIRLDGAVLADQNEEWTEGRGYFSVDALARALTMTNPAPETGAGTMPTVNA